MIRRLRLRSSAGDRNSATDRRRFLSLAGASALGAGATLVRQRAGGETRPSDEDEEEQGSLAKHGRGVRRVIWSVNTDEPHVALTFDDGPDPRFTPRILEILDRYGIRATFMAMGYNASVHSSLMREVVAAGHEIGSHTWTHRNFRDLDPEATREEIVRGAQMIEEVTGVKPTLFRPPRGRMTEAGFAYVADRGYDVVMWSVSRGALAERDPDTIAGYVTDRIGPGDIVLLHDGIGRGTFNPGEPVERRLSGRRESEVQALPRMIEGIQALGLKPESVGSLLARQKVM